MGLPWMENIFVPVLIVWMGDDKKLSWYENIFYVMVSWRVIQRGPGMAKFYNFQPYLKVKSLIHIVRIMEDMIEDIGK